MIFTFFCINSLCCQQTYVEYVDLKELLKSLSIIHVYVLAVLNSFIKNGKFVFYLKYLYMAFYNLCTETIQCYLQNDRILDISTE